MGAHCCIRSLSISGDTSEVYHYIIPLYSHLDLRPEPLHLPVCVGVKGPTAFQIHFSHLYGKRLEEDSKKAEEEAKKSEMTKALVFEITVLLESKPLRAHFNATCIQAGRGEPICDTDPSIFYGYQGIPERHTSWSVI